MGAKHVKEGGDVQQSLRTVNFDNDGEEKYKVTMRFNSRLAGQSQAKLLDPRTLQVFLDQQVVVDPPITLPGEAASATCKVKGDCIVVVLQKAPGAHGLWEKE